MRKLTKEKMDKTRFDTFQKGRDADQYTLKWFYSFRDFSPDSMTYTQRSGDLKFNII